MRFNRYSPEIEDYRPLIAQVEHHATPGDVVFYNAPWHIGYFEAYYHGPQLDFRPLEPGKVEAVLDEPRQVWVMARDIVRRPGGATTEDRAEDLLSAGAFKADEAWFGRVRLTRYGVPPKSTTTPHPVGAEFSRGVVLDEFTIQPELQDGKMTLKPGQAVYLVLNWQSNQTLDRGYHVFSHIIGSVNPATGNPVWAQHDGVPVNQERPTTSWVQGEHIRDGHIMWLDAGAPPGQYVLEVGMYDPGTGERLQVLQHDGTTTDHVVLAQIRVATP
jgi:hypothetical protein